MIRAREEREAADDLPVFINPVSHGDPFVVANRDRDGRIMFGEFHFYHFPVFEKFKRGDIVFEDGIFRRLNWEVDDVSGGGINRLAHFGVIGNLLITKHFEKRVGMRDPDAADIEFGVARVETRGTVNSLREIAGGFDASDTGGFVNFETLGIFLVDADGFIF